MRVLIIQQVLRGENTNVGGPHSLHPTVSGLPRDGTRHKGGNREEGKRKQALEGGKGADSREEKEKKGGGGGGRWKRQGHEQTWSYSRRNSSTSLSAMPPSSPACSTLASMAELSSASPAFIGEDRLRAYIACRLHEQLVTVRHRAEPQRRRWCNGLVTGAMGAV